MAQHQIPVSAPPNGVAPVPDTAQFVSVSFYYGDLDQNVDESQLYDLFSLFGQVVSVRLCRDLTTRRSLGCGYVSFGNAQDAVRAFEALNLTPVNYKPIRIMGTNCYPSIPKSSNAIIFIKNLDEAIDHKSLHDTFSAFGNILSCKVARNASGQSNGYGFVKFENEESALEAIDKLNGMLINDKQVHIGLYLREQDRENAPSKKELNYVYVKNLADSVSDEDLKKIFGEYGTITSAVVVRDADDKSMCFGFVNFENPDDAVKAVEALNGKEFDDKEWYVVKAIDNFNGMLFDDKQVYVGRFLRKKDKENSLSKKKFNYVFVKNLEDSVSDEDLKKIFGECGTITSAVVVRDADGKSKCFGFAYFKNPDDAAKAAEALKGKKIDDKVWYAVKAQEEI